MGASILWYITFSLLGAALSTQEQKPGLRISLSLAVVFCLNEVQVLQLAAREDSASSNFSLISFLPARLCLFEKVMKHISSILVDCAEPPLLSVPFQPLMLLQQDYGARWACGVKKRHGQHYGAQPDPHWELVPWIGEKWLTWGRHGLLRHQDQVPEGLAPD